MPIYEYRCKDCRKEMSFIVLSVRSAEELRCKFCQSSHLSLLVSRFATPLSEESRLERLADPSLLGGLDENDPQSMARLMKRMGKELGEEMDMDIDQAIEEAMDGEKSEDSPAAGGPSGMPGAGEW